MSTTDTETGSFSEIATITNENYADMPSTRGVDLGAYNGQEIYVAFRLITRDGYMLTIDNVGFYGDIEKAGQSGVENISDNAAITVDNNWVRCTAEKVESISVYDASGRIVAQNSNSSSSSDQFRLFFCYFKFPVIGCSHKKLIPVSSELILTQTDKISSI